MLKIRSFLRLTKDSIMNFIKKMFQRYSRHMAATAYALSAVILVFYFGDLANLNVDKSRLVVDASSYEIGTAKLKETNTSELLMSDNKEYALIGPDNHILRTQQDLLLAASSKEMTNLFQSDKKVLADITNFTESKVQTTKDRIGASDTLGDQANFAKASKEEHQKPYSEGGQDSDKDQAKDTAKETAKDSEKDTAKDTVKDTEKDTAKDTAKDSAKEQIKDTEKDQAKDSTKDQSEESSEAAEAVAASKKSVPSNLKLVMNSAMKKSLPSDELKVLQRIVEAEASGEDIYGKILVANVVINRMNTEEFPDTVSEVVFQKVGGAYQFSPTNDGRYWTVKISKSTKEAVKRALNGEDYSKGALYFFARKLTTEKKARWFDNSLRKVVQYGCHEFYADK